MGLRLYNNVETCVQAHPILWKESFIISVFEAGNKNLMNNAIINVFANIFDKTIN